MGLVMTLTHIVLHHILFYLRVSRAERAKRVSVCRYFRPVGGITKSLFRNGEFKARILILLSDFSTDVI